MCVSHTNNTNNNNNKNNQQANIHNPTLRVKKNEMAKKKSRKIRKTKDASI